MVMVMNYLSNNDIKDQKVILRCDFNVPVKDGKITDNSKIIKSLDTINLLLNNNNIVILMSHFGRVKTEEDKEKNSLKIVYEELKKYLDLEFISDSLNLDSIYTSSKKCFLVENTRFTDVPNKRESVNDLKLAEYWAGYGDIFVLDAFASLHRAHSSTAALSRYLPTYLGLLVEKEIKNLDELVNVTKRPFMVIMGGAKVDDKIEIINELIKKCDKLVITGGILNTFLKCLGFNIGNSLVSTDDKVLEDVQKILKDYQDKIIYSDKFIVKRGNENVEVSLNEIKDDDIIYDNLVDIKEYLNDIKLVFLNGTCGMYENGEYAQGTKKILTDLAGSKASVYVGGGDSLSAVSNLGFENSFTYLSSGGGATLEYVSSGKLKALEYIKEVNK